MEPHKMTVAQYLRHWLTVSKTFLAPKTHERYQDICENNIIPALGSIEIVKLTAVDVERFYSDMLSKGRKPKRKEKSKKESATEWNRGLSPTTVLQFHRILHKALKDATEKRIVSHNIANAAKAPRAVERELEVPDENAMALLLAQVRKDSRVYLPTLIASGTGLRRGEILALRWSDVHLETGAARIVRSLCQTRKSLVFKDVKKKKRRRVVTLPGFVLDGLREALEEQRKDRQMVGPDYQDHDLICCLPDGNPIPPDTVSWTFRRYRRTLGLRTRFHDLRHGHASQALQNGVPIKTVQARLGHATAAFTLDRYGHLMPGDDQRAAEVIEQKLGAAIERFRQKPVN